MRYVKCPENFYPGFNEFSLFMAGGISNTSDWQSIFRSLLIAEASLVLINPRRDKFDITDPEAPDIQIEWEHLHLERAQGISFWFSPETLCPITLFELGKVAAGTKKPIFVGAHKQYKRRLDVVKQLTYIRPEVKVVHNLVDLSQQVKDYLKDNSNGN